MRLDIQPGGSAEVTQESGATVQFADGGSGVGWVSQARNSATLESNGDGTATFRRNHFDSFTFSETDGHLLSMSDQFNNTTTVNYPPGSTEAASLVDDAGRVLDIDWVDGRIDSVTDQLTGSGGPRSLQFDYNTTGDLINYTDATGGVWTFTYDTQHRMLTMTKPRHFGTTKSVVNHYDTEGRVDWQEDELDRRTTLAYDTPTAGITTVELPDGTVRQHHYDNGLRVKTVDGFGTAAATTTQYAYDPATLALVSVTDNAGNITSFTNDASGNRTSMTDPSGRVTRWTYNAFDQVTSTAVGETAAPLPASTASVVTSTVTIDGLGRTTHATDAVGTAEEATTTFGYDPSNPDDLITVTDARNKVWSFGYDPDTGDPTASIDPLGNETTTTYNNIGWVLTETSPKGTATPTPGDYTTSYNYDVSTRTTTVTGPTGDVTTTVLDANGNTATLATGVTGSNPTGDVTSYGYTDADELATVDPPGLGAKSYEYWPGGQRKKFTNETGGAWNYTYDAAGRLATEIDPLAKVTTYGYDTARRLATITQPGAGHQCSVPKLGCITYSYDTAGRPTTVDYSDPATPDVTAITYDDLGRRTAATASGVTETWSWDTRSRLVSNTDRNGRTVSYGWDDNSNLTAISYPGQSVPVARSFDDANRLTAVTDWAGRTTNFGYDANSNWTDTTFPSASTNSDQYGYDQADRMTSATWKQGSTVLGSESYTRPLKGMVDVATPTGAAGSTATDYGYDDRDRLTSANTDTYAYDPASNLTETADGNLQVYDAAQQLCWSSPTAPTGTCTTPASDATTYTYDDQGNRATRTEPGGPALKHSYDQANRLTAVTSPELAEGGDGQYHEITSNRILDTRSSIGTCTGGCPAKVTNGQSVDVVVGQSPIPASNVEAVAATVTVLEANIAGYLRVNENASGTAAAGTVNFDATEPANEFVIIPVVDGKVSLDIYGTSRQAEVVIDVTGYYTSADGATGTVFTGKAPATRLVDTRNQTGHCPTSSSLCDEFDVPTRTSQTVQASGRAGIPSAGVKAAVLNVTVVPKSADGILRVAPASAGAAATMNFTANTELNSVVIAPLDSNGRFTMTANADADVIIDVAGWYTNPDDAGSSASTLETIDPARFVDTRTPAGTCTPSCAKLVANAQTKVTVRGTGGVPEDATSVVAFVTVLQPDLAGYLRINPNGSGVGTGGTATVNYTTDGAGMTVIAPIASDGTITVASNRGTHVVIDITAYMTAPTWTYDYGVDGLRTSKTSPTGTETHFTWTAYGGLPLLLGEHQGNDATWLIQGPGGQPVQQVEADGSVTWLHHDQLRSVRLATSENTGEVVSARSWGAYGKPSTSTGTRHPVLGFAGEYSDRETGYAYLRARYLDPDTAQFLSRDPQLQRTNEPYGYSASNPITFVDPTGLEWWDPRDWDQDIVDAAKNVMGRSTDIVVAARNAGVTAPTAIINSWTGGDCDWDKNLTVVCYGGAIADLSDRTYVTGSTINTPLSKYEYRTVFGGNLHRHETVHTRQWALFGWRFPALYGLEALRTGGDECQNVFEIWAGLEDGGYG